jgi:hypothetical protein
MSPLEPSCPDKVDTGYRVAGRLSSFTAMFGRSTDENVNDVLQDIEPRRCRRPDIGLSDDGIPDPIVADFGKGDI